MGEAPPVDRVPPADDPQVRDAAVGLARVQEGRGLDEEHIVPTMGDWEVFPREAAAVGVKAQEQGVARLSLSYDELLNHATQKIRQAQDMTRSLMENGIIPPVPEEWA